MTVNERPTAKPRRISVAPPSDWELREGAWAILRSAKDLNASGHERAVRWARAFLGLDDR